MKTRQLTQNEIIDMSLAPIPGASAPLYIPSEERITEMLRQGYDSYVITKTLNCSAYDVVNAERRSRGLKRMMKPTPELEASLIDEQITEPARRLRLFPPVAEQSPTL